MSSKKGVKYVDRDLSFIVMKTFSPSSIHLATSGITVGFKKMASKIQTEEIADLAVKSIRLGVGTENNTYATLSLKVNGEIGTRPIVNMKGSSYVMADSHDPVYAHAVLPKNERLKNEIMLHGAERNSKPFSPSKQFSDLSVEDYISKKGNAWQVAELYHIKEESPFIEYLVFQRCQDVVDEYKAGSKEIFPPDKLADIEKQAKVGVLKKLKSDYDFDAHEKMFKMDAHFVLKTLDLIKKALSSCLTVEKALHHTMVVFNRVRPSTRGEWDLRDDAELYAAAQYEESSKNYLHEQNYTLQVELIISVDYPVNKYS